MEVTNKTKGLYRRLQAANNLLKTTNNPNDKIALCNYIGNIYDAISSVGDKKIIVKKKDIFGSNKYHKKFHRKLVKLEDIMLEKFIQDKEFHSSYMGEVCFGVEQLHDDDPEYNVDLYQELSKSDFDDIFFQFMKSINLDGFLEDYLKKSNIYSYKLSDDNHTLGMTLYNPVNRDVDVLIGDFILDIQALFTLAHEFGHVYDMSLFEGNTEEYNRYFYQSFYGEVVSKLFERLFLSYMINNNILKEEAQDKLMEVDDNNHDYLLTSYILSLLDEDLIRDSAYSYLSEEELIEVVNKYFNNNISEFVSELDYVDLQEDFTYAYGDIVSMFIKDSIDKYGFSNELIDEFLKVRSNLFDEEFFREFGMGPDNYLDLYKKELKLLKK